MRLRWCVAFGCLAAATTSCSEMRGFPTDTLSGSDASTQDVQNDLATPMDVAMDQVTPPEDSAPGEDAVGQDAVVRPDVAIGPVDEVIRLPGAAMNADTLFADPPVAGVPAPTIVYPTSGTVIPPNLTGLEYHLRGPSGVQLFELSFVGRNGRVRVYSTCTAVADGCVVSLTDEAMGHMANASIGGELAVSVRARTSAGAGMAATGRLGMSSNEMRGGVYYWSSAGAIMRYEFGLPGARREAFLQGDPINCVGCHALSRDGTRMSVGRGIPGPAVSSTYDVMSRMTVGGNYGSNFGTFSPDNAKLLTSNGATLTVVDTMTGMAVSGFPTGTQGTQPDWSPDGANIVFSLPAMPPPLGFGQPGHNAPANLMLMAYNSGTGRFGSTRVLVSAMGENNYYPSIAPDSSWVLFNRSSGGSYDAPDAQLWAVSTTHAPVRLQAADGTGDLGNSWPRWSPFRDTYDGTTLYWLTFSSRRDYGLRLRNQSMARDNQKVQLWMAGFRLDRSEMRLDPSTPAFWLPFQALNAGNHIAQWTAQIRRRTCTADTECAPGERCVPLATVGGSRCVGGG
ncbi:MAG: hypothetical protein Q8Q09_16650 [Deltaproteobacteria bacterium]|nr:hypothetical protein [Deltaproteobacteria bacterium]